MINFAQTPPSTTSGSTDVARGSICPVRCLRAFAVATLAIGVPVQRCTVHYAALRIMPTSAAKPAWEALISVKDAA
jgi:hypothetical protein